MDKKLKKIIAREGLLFLPCITVIYIPIYLLIQIIRFIVWAVKILREDKVKGTVVDNMPIRLLRKIFYKQIPKDSYRIRNLNCLLDFKDRKYNYFEPRFFPLSDSDDKSIKLEFTTFKGDITIIRFAPLSDDFTKEFRNKNNKGEKLLYVLDKVFELDREGRNTKKTDKIINKGSFNNDCWKGAILEVESTDDKGTNILALTTVVPPEAPEDLYSENVKLLKSCCLTEKFKEKYKFYESL
jgi:hypothetical protein